MVNQFLSQSTYVGEEPLALLVRLQNYPEIQDNGPNFTTLWASKQQMSFSFRGKAPDRPDQGLCPGALCGFCRQTSVIGLPSPLGIPWTKWWRADAMVMQITSSVLSTGGNIQWVNDNENTLLHGYEAEISAWQCVTLRRRRIMPIDLFRRCNCRLIHFLSVKCHTVIPTFQGEDDNGCDAALRQNGQTKCRAPNFYIFAPW